MVLGSVVGLVGGVVVVNGFFGVGVSVGGVVFGGYFEIFFSFGMNYRILFYFVGDYCFLCRSEWKDFLFLESGIKIVSKLVFFMVFKGNSVLYLLLWVCLDCCRIVEKEERYGGFD